MKVVRVREFGSPDVLQIDNADEPLPHARAVVVAVGAIGLGYMDTAARRGESYLATSPDFIPGYEIAGTIVGIGTDVEAKWMDRRVFALLRRGGGCAERVEMPLEEIIPLPDGITFVDAVATGLNALVAQVGLARVPMTEASRILVRGAGGGIGLMCVQYASLRGGAIVATTSSRERGERLLALGASLTWNRFDAGGDDLGSFDVVIDTVIGPGLTETFDRLNPNGHYVMCGGIGGMPPSDFGMKILEHFHRSPTLYAFSLNSASLEDVSAEAERLFGHVRAGRIVPVVDSVMPLTDIVLAHRKLDEGGAFGKIVLEPD